MSRSSMLFFAVLSAAGCQGSQLGDPSNESPIIGGVDDTGDPAVAALFSHQPGATHGELCTATVISPTVLITAAHCTLAQPGAIYEVIFNPALKGAPASTRAAVLEVHHDTAFNESDLQGGHDIGVAILASAVSITPVPYNQQPIPQAMVGEPVRLVGYGLNQGPAQMGTGAGTKRQVTTVLDDFSDALLHIGTSGKDTCSGDSGGPAFMNINGVETIVGVTSFGDGACSGGGYDTRVDTYASFVNPFLGGGGAVDGGSGGAGGKGGGGAVDAGGSGGGGGKDGGSAGGGGGKDGGSGGAGKDGGSGSGGGKDGGVGGGGSGGGGNDGGIGGGGSGGGGGKKGGGKKEGGGCSMAAQGQSSPAGFGLLLLIGIGLVARRRRA